MKGKEALNFARRTVGRSPLEKREYKRARRRAVRRTAARYTSRQDFDTTMPKIGPAPGA